MGKCGKWMKKLIFLLLFLASVVNAQVYRKVWIISDDYSGTAHATFTAVGYFHIANSTDSGDFFTIMLPTGSIKTKELMADYLFGDGSGITGLADTGLPDNAGVIASTHVQTNAIIPAKLDRAYLEEHEGVVVSSTVEDGSITSSDLATSYLPDNTGVVVSSTIEDASVSRADLDRAYIEERVGVVVSSTVEDGSIASADLDTSYLPDNVSVVASSHLAPSIAIPDNVGVITTSHTAGNQMTFSSATATDLQAYSVAISTLNNTLSKIIMGIVSSASKSPSIQLYTITSVTDISIVADGGSSKIEFGASGNTINGLIKAYGDLTIRGGGATGVSIQIGDQTAITEFDSDIQFGQSNKSFDANTSGKFYDGTVELVGNPLLTTSLRLEQMNAETWEFRNNGNTAYVGIAASSGTFTRYVQIGSRTTAELKLITPSAAGQCWRNSDNDSIYMSTGATQYGFVKFSGGATD
jgi:hypothetical protein